MGFPVLRHMLSTSFLPLGILPQVSEVWVLGTSLPLSVLAGKHAVVVWVAFALENKSLNQVAFFPAWASVWKGGGRLLKPPVEK